MSTTKKIEMEYAGPEVDENTGNKPANIRVDPGEVDALIKAGGWRKASAKAKDEAAKPEKEVTDG